MLKPIFFKLVGIGSLVVIVLLADMHLAMADILIRSTPRIRIRLGSNGGVDTVIYNAGIPVEMNGLAGASGVPTISTNIISGGSGVFSVRVITDINARFNTPVPLTGTYSYDSSSPLTCTTPATCGGTTIDFDTISWTARDSDTHNTVFRYNKSASQQAHEQTDNNGGGAGQRHRNFFRYSYDNDVLLPAGTYLGTIGLNGSAN